MNLPKFVVTVAMAFCAQSLLAQTEEVEPVARWFEGFGWETSRAVSFSAEVITEPDGLPIGVSFKTTALFLKSAPETVGPWPCSFRGVGWALCENFGYSARFVLGPDRGLVGISLRVWNNSRTSPLVLIKSPGSLPFFYEISQVDGPDFPRRNQGGYLDLYKPKEMEEWTLPPRAREYFFMPIRDLLPPDFSPVKGAEYLLQIYINTVPKGTVPRHSSIYPMFNGLWATITETSLSIDPQAALKEAQVTMEKDL